MASSSKAWILVHIMFPLSPFLIGGILRLLISTPSIDTFSATELAMSLGLLSLFVHQNLVNGKHLLNVGDRENDIRVAATLFTMWAIGFFVLFGCISTLKAIMSNSDAKSFEPALRNVQIFVFCIAPFLIRTTCRTQRSFKLRATI